MNSKFLFDSVRIRLLFALLLTTVMVMLEIADLGRLNAESLRLLRSVDDIFLDLSHTFCRQDRSMPFVEILRILRSINDRDYALEKSCIEAQIANFSRGRQMILRVHQAELSWRLGAHEYACQQLESLNAKPQIIQLAQRSAHQKDMEITALYLDCFNRSSVGTSHSIAMLYRDLALYYQTQGMSDKVFWAYSQAAKFYPGVWSEPYIVQADMLWQRGQRLETIQLLQDALSRSTTATATFQLARALGLRLEETGQFCAAYCAIQQALQVERGVSLNNAPESWRVDLRQRLARLKDVISPSCQIECDVR